MLLTQNTGRVAVDTTGTALFSDLTWSDATKWIQLADFSNWRFYLTTLNNFSSYQTSFSILNTYTSIGLYNIILTFSSSGQTFQQTVDITDRNFNFFSIKSFYYLSFFSTHKK